MEGCLEGLTVAEHDLPVNREREVSVREGPSFPEHQLLDVADAASSTHQLSVFDHSRVSLDEREPQGIVIAQVGG